jgi:hypothetical protein
LFLDNYFRIGRFEKWEGLLILEKGIFGFILSTRLKSATPSKTETKKQRAINPTLLKLINGKIGEYGMVHATWITRPTKIIKPAIKSPVAIGSFPIFSLSYSFGVKSSNRWTPSQPRKAQITAYSTVLAIQQPASVQKPTSGPKGIYIVPRI